MSKSLLLQVQVRYWFAIAKRLVEMVFIGLWLSTRKSGC